LATPFHTGLQTDVHFVKAKLIQGVPCDINDFFVVKHTLPLLPQEECDEIEEILKKKFTFGVPEIEIHRFEAAILKECVKVKVERGLPIDKLGSKILREAIKAKVIRGDPVDEKEAKICANNIKSKLIKGKPVDQLDIEILLDYVKNKVARREPLTNLEAELCLEVLKQKVTSGQPLDSAEAEIIVDCVKNKAKRGSPLGRFDEDLLIAVVQQKQAGRARVDNWELEMVTECLKNKEKRGEPLHPLAHIQILPHEVKQPFSLLDKTDFNEKIRFRYTTGKVGGQYGLGLGLQSQYLTSPFTAYGFGKFPTCPSTGVYGARSCHGQGYGCPVLPKTPFGVNPLVYQCQFGSCFKTPFGMNPLVNQCQFGSCFKTPFTHSVRNLDIVY
jgi:hypothetical protein